MKISTRWEEEDVFRIEARELFFDFEDELEVVILSTNFSTVSEEKCGIEKP